MAAAYLDALLELAPPGALAGVYAKGSAYRPWDTVLDYVPELSDVDLHVRSSGEPGALDRFRTVGGALELATRALDLFNSRFPAPTHVPRPQLLFLDDLEGLPGYLPSPDHLVTTLFGRPYQGGSRGRYAGTRAEDRERLLADAAFIEGEVPLKVIDRPGPLAWRVVFLLQWRVGPGAPRLLTQLGADPWDAWSLNRTALVRELTALAGSELAEAYARFYLAGWEGFRSGFRDGAAAARAVLAAASFFGEGRALLEARAG